MVYAYHSLAIHLLRGHLGRQFGAISSEAALNICVQVLCEHSSHFSGTLAQDLKLLGHMVIACLVLKETIKPFSE